MMAVGLSVGKVAKVACIRRVKGRIYASSLRVYVPFTVEDKVCPGLKFILVYVLSVVKVAKVAEFSRGTGGRI